MVDVSVQVSAAPSFLEDVRFTYKIKFTALLYTVLSLEAYVSSMAQRTSKSLGWYTSYSSPWIEIDEDGMPVVNNLHPVCFSSQFKVLLLISNWGITKMCFVLSKTRKFRSFAEQFWMVLSSWSYHLGSFDQDKSGKVLPIQGRQSCSSSSFLPSPLQGGDTCISTCIFLLLPFTCSGCSCPASSPAPLPDLPMVSFPLLPFNCCGALLPFPSSSPP